MEKIQNLLKQKNVQNIAYFIAAVLVMLLVWFSSEIFHINPLNDYEAKSYDLRHRINLVKKETDPNIIILEIDDSSIDVLEEQYGRMPWERSVYVDAINFLNRGKADSIIFDLMFIGYNKGFKDQDNQLIKSIADNKNVYVAMNFDYKEREYKPLPDHLATKVQNDSDIDYSAMQFSSCRYIMQEIINSTPNIGFINFKRDSDGISRRAPTFFKYKDKFYPYLALKVGANYLKKHGQYNDNEFKIDKNRNLLIGNKKLKLDKEGFTTLNWYGTDGTYTKIPFWKVIKSEKTIKEGGKPRLSPDFFKDKIVFIGVTATSMYDIKTIPINRVYPGVEVQATYLNNILDNSTIKKASPQVNIAINILLMLLTFIAVIRIRSTIIASSTAIGIMLCYIAAATIALEYYNLWIGMFYQIVTMVITFTFIYLIMYINKSKDLEYTYKLATTDGLTNLYNHRYFQEQMSNNIDSCKRYKNNFSLLLIDIDFFKKFNDTYGHQAGDAVLKQVAALLKKSVRSSDLVARYGGEEMAIVLPNTGLDEAYITAQKICQIIAEKPFHLGEGIQKHVTISLGVSTYPLHGETTTELIEFSDQGLYAAKENGRNQVGGIKGYTPPSKEEVT